MQFANIDAFIDMGGYGFYVWVSYGSAALCIFLLIVLSKQKHNKTLHTIQQRLRRESKRKAAALQQTKNSVSNLAEGENEPTS